MLNSELLIRGIVALSGVGDIGDSSWRLTGLKVKTPGFSAISNSEDWQDFLYSFPIQDEWRLILSWIGHVPKLSHV
jgi:hypothetical protein